MGRDDNVVTRIRRISDKRSRSRSNRHGRFREIGQLIIHRGNIFTSFFIPTSLPGIRVPIRQLSNINGLNISVGLNNLHIIIK
ncbi:hypothetical protein AQUCO_09700001v1 [Aquilegia coerulea]|uniref:Uncharacterized protein n=1 Tax=Aquilegia coerulea TaxID=218851 RepID=A0A2G5C4E1_AQUCA|nr:hypothetical protein AQUCO_09700001v1 [Aquilegia coerulea]